MKSRQFAVDDGKRNQFQFQLQFWRGPFKAQNQFWVLAFVGHFGKLHFAVRQRWQKRRGRAKRLLLLWQFSAVSAIATATATVTTTIVTKTTTTTMHVNCFVWHEECVLGTGWVPTIGMLRWLYVCLSVSQSVCLAVFESFGAPHVDEVQTAEFHF